MKYYLKFAIYYFCFCIAVVVLTRGTDLSSFDGVVARALGLAPAMVRIAIIFFLVSAIWATVTKNRKLGPMGISIVQALCATVLLQAGFTLFKTSMPAIVPFFADAQLAYWDNLLHGGQDPWALAYSVAPSLPMNVLIPFYLHVWAWPAVFLPIIMAATDSDKDRVKRTMILFLMAWVLIGNVLALAGLSAGPVFYDRIYGGDRFAELTAMMALYPEMSEYFVRIQDDLWWSYSTQQQSVGSGISAFPSVHLSVSMVAALYMYERARILGLLGAMFVVIILFLSVFSGYHYALDGYVSIVVMWSIWFVMRRRSAAVHGPKAVERPAESLVGASMSAG